MHPMQIAVAILLVPVYWWAMRQTDEARQTLRAPAYLITAFAVFVVMAIFGGVVYAQGFGVPWPTDPWCSIFWFLGVPGCWF